MPAVHELVEVREGLPWLRGGSRALGCALACAWALAGCAPVAKAPEPAPAPAPVIREVYVPVHVPAPAPPPEASPEDTAMRNFLAYYEKVRQMSPAELNREFARLDPPAGPAAILEFATALGQTRNPWDTARALGVLDPLLRTTDPAAAPWQGLARLLAWRYAEQRRVEEHAERQTQLLRDTQRRLEQANQQIEALKAIERSLSPRPSASAAPGAAAARTPP